MARDKPKLLDLFSGAGGAAMGYARAGFDVTGVDHKEQPRYPFRFVQGDAFDYLESYGWDYDIIHASPPCQAYSRATWAAGDPKKHKDLLGLCRDRLRGTGLPYVIENVPDAPMHNALMLCGTMFGLPTLRHRLFETYPEQLWFPPATCGHVRRSGKLGRRVLDSQYFSVVGHFSDVEGAKTALGIDWMTRGELSQAVPPAYTEFIGEQMMSQLRVLSTPYPHEIPTE